MPSERGTMPAVASVVAPDATAEGMRRHTAGHNAHAHMSVFQELPKMYVCVS